MALFIAILRSAAIFTLTLELQPAVLRVHLELSKLSASFKVFLYGEALTLT